MEKDKKPVTYEQVGVSIDSGNSLVRKIIEEMKQTWDSSVIPNPGGFAALVRFPGEVELPLKVISFQYPQRTKRDYNSVKAENKGEIPIGVRII